MSRFVVPDEQDGQRLDVVVAGLLDVSRSRAAARLAAGDVTLAGRPAGKQQRVRAGQTVEVRAAAPAAAPPAPPPLPPVRYQDAHLLVVAKPAGMVVHPGHGRPHGTLVDALRGAGVPLAAVGGDERPGIVHRLDRDTSGLLVVAKTDAAHAGLVSALKRRQVARRYLAVVQGVPPNRRGRVEAPLARAPGDRTRFAVRADGKPAVTRYVVLDDVAAGGSGQHVAALACALETGRTHQIRVHLAALGHPILADTTYRGSATLAERLGVSRIALHAGRLAFVHPITGVEVAVDEPLPDDLAALRDRLGLRIPTGWWEAIDHGAAGATAVTDATDTADAEEGPS
ncbi:RluA family pseudouridine synthase [Egicoccus sp. AB-alg2]|uniref:RluA family pseudouridine synthase n=1 Tax=Egicoccus sp. AB-alg2 TaxID=3242693 RepID=UPI00359E457D